MRIFEPFLCGNNAVIKKGDSEDRAMPQL